jgi:preprotein translocase subunit SecD
MPENWLCCDVTGLASPATRFTEADLDPAGILSGIDQVGYPCIDVAARPERMAHLRAVTTPWVDRQVACVLGDELLVAPQLNSALGGSFPVGDRFTYPERDALLDVLRAAAMHGRLPFRPTLKRVMPTTK